NKSLNEDLVNLINQDVRLCQNFLGLPLVSYKNNKKSLISSEEAGFSIAHRIEIVRKGHQTGNINACIRTTSNYLFWSAYFYATKLELSLFINIDIDKLRYIS